MSQREFSNVVKVKLGCSPETMADKCRVKGFTIHKNDDGDIIGIDTNGKEYAMAMGLDADDFLNNQTSILFTPISSTTKE